MSYFLPSSIQKRLLRYALSQWDLLDADALDLDNLDIAWGKKSVIKLSDVGLHKPRLAALLSLPECFELKHALLASVEITVPADLYSSSIFVEAYDCEAILDLRETVEKVEEAVEPPIQPSSRRKYRPRTSLRSSTTFPRSQDSSSSFSSTSDDTESAFPTPYDLAMSFLQEEPIQERKEMEATLASKSADLRQSVTSVASSEDDVNTGFGLGIGLPTFLTGFLQGIGERLRVRLNGVTIRLNLSADLKLDESSANGKSLHSFALHVASVDLHEQFSAMTATNEDPAKGGEKQQPAEAKVGDKRQLVFKDVWGALLSGKLEKLDGSGNISSARTDTHDVVDGTPMSQHLGAATHSRGSLDKSGAYHDVEVQDQPLPSNVKDDIQDQYNSICDESGSSQHRQLLSELDDAIMEGSVAYQDLNNDDERLSSLDNSTERYSDQLHAALKSCREERPQSRLSEYYQARRHASRSASPSSNSSSQLPLNSSIPPLSNVGANGRDARNQEIIHNSHYLPRPSDHVEDTGPQHQDLAQSMLFDTSAAESLYMSAIGDRSPTGSMQYRMPGAWDDVVELDRSSGITGTFSSQDAQTKCSSTDEPIEMQEAVVNSKTTKTVPAKTMKAALVPARKVFDLDRLDVWFSSCPTVEQSDSASGHFHNTMNPQQSQSSRPGTGPVAGSFSFYAESKAGTKSFAFSSPTEAKHDRRGPGETTTLFEILLHSLHSQIDIPTAGILAEVLQFVLKTIPYAESTKSHTTLAQSDNAHSSRYRMRLRALHLQVLEKIRESSIRIADTGSYSILLNNSTLICPIIFVLRAKDLTASIPNEGSSVAKVEVESMAFGFEDEHIVSFSKQARMSSSLRDSQASLTKDVSVTLTPYNNTLDVHVGTRPMKLRVDLQRLDHVLGHVGGLSGLLELDKSVASDSTVTRSNTNQQPRLRAVHFESKPSAENVVALPARPRLNVRLGGISASLRGKSTELHYRSSSVKIVSRDTMLGLQIDDMRLSGPYQPSESSDADCSVRIRGMSVRYLTTPEEADLTKLISLLTPSKDKFENDDDFLVDTLIRQRMKGAVLRVNITSAELDLDDATALVPLQELYHEVSSMQAITKYMPEESRPGLMLLAAVGTANLKLETGRSIGCVSGSFKNTEIAHISFPQLVAVSVADISVHHGEGQPLLAQVLPLTGHGQPPMLMARMIGDELEPTVRVKLWNVCIEYNVPLALSLLGLPENTTSQELDVKLTSSIAALTRTFDTAHHTRTGTGVTETSAADTKPLVLDLALRDCTVGLTPLNLPSKALFVLTDARLSGSPPHALGMEALFNLRKGAILIVDDVKNLHRDPRTVLTERDQSQGAVGYHIADLCKLGFVSVSSISAASISIKLKKRIAGVPDVIDLEIKDELFLLETCADSTQTLIDTLSALKPPMPPSQGVKYRTEVTPIQDMMASFSGDAFTMRSSRHSGDAEGSDEGIETDFDDLSDMGGIEPNGQPALGHKYGGYPGTNRSSRSPTNGGSTGANMHSPQPFEDSDDFMDPKSGQRMIANKWNSTNNRYVRVSTSELASSPLQIKIRDTHFIWNLHDGYDWDKTRETITKAVQDVEAKAVERRARIRKPLEKDEDKESLIGDFLFNSIYIGIPAGHDPHELTRQINRNMDDLVSETASHTSTITSRPSNSRRTSRGQPRRLKLERSKRHKVAFELRGVNADIIGFIPGGETQMSIDEKITDAEIFDHVPTSTWKKFLTYMHDAGPKHDRPMVHLEICDVRPIPELEATELVIKAIVLPVRLHVDQDALDFITRFFDFKDDSQTGSQIPTEQPYLQRVEVEAVPLKLDYKPKRIDFAGLRSGRTKEFMNFVNLDGADMVLKHTIVYGTSGLAKLHSNLEDVWLNDIKSNQLPGVLSGINGVRSLVNVGTGVRDLVVIPVREYRKDGRVVRSISKGAMAFAKTTGGELTRFGAKLAVGAANALQGAEDYLVGPSEPGSSHRDDITSWDTTSAESEDERHRISNYANQPATLLQGLKGAARSLERDLLVTKDVIVAISGEARESGTAEGAARAVVRHAPTLILRPMIGASKAISQTLMGATNSVDPENRRRMEDKYKRY